MLKISYGFYFEKLQAWIFAVNNYFITSKKVRMTVLVLSEPSPLTFSPHVVQWAFFGVSTISILKFFFTGKMKV